MDLRTQWKVTIGYKFSETFINLPLTSTLIPGEAGGGEGGGMAASNALAQRVMERRSQKIDAAEVRMCAFCLLYI
jgi:hypothetical protein